MLKQTHHIAKLLTLSLVISLSLVFAFPSTTNAATLLPVPGNDENTDNSSCSLTEAIENINNQNNANPDCLAGDGNDDTITLAIGTYTLTADLPQITESITIEGQGMGDTVIDGDGQWVAFSASNQDANFVFQGLTITAYVDSAAIYADSGDVTLESIEVDGSGTSFSGGVTGIGITNTAGTTDNTVVLNNVYVHDLNHDTSAINTIGIGTSGSVATNFTANNITISDIHNSLPGGAVNGFLVGVGLFGGNPGTEGIFGTASNITITDIQSADSVNGFGVIAAAGGFNNTSSTVTLRNATISKLSSGTQGSAVTAGGAGFLADDTGSANLVIENLLLADNDLQGGCQIADIGYIFGGLGTGTGTISSSGGNLSDDTNCEDYFTESSDQNNVTGLAASIEPLADNGGYVPTMALLEGSPAIDAGVTVAGLTTDARGALRPQGNAYDSGAYESPFTRQEEDNQNTGQETLAETGENSLILSLMPLAMIISSMILLHFRNKLLV